MGFREPEGRRGAFAHAALACLSKQAESAHLVQYRGLGCG